MQDSTLDAVIAFLTWSIFAVYFGAILWALHWLGLLAPTVGLIVVGAVLVVIYEQQRELRVRRQERAR